MHPLEANQLIELDRLIEIRDRLSLPSLYEQVLNAPDLYKTINYLDAGTPDERITNITISSPSLNAEFYDNYTYSGTSGNYRVITISRAQGTPSNVSN